MANGMQCVTFCNCGLNGVVVVNGSDLSRFYSTDGNTSSNVLQEGRMANSIGSRKNLKRQNWQKYSIWVILPTLQNFLNVKFLELLLRDTARN